jgi:hypothetical protein
MRRADLVTAGLFFLLGLVTILVVIPSYVTGGTRDGELSPAFMPYVAAVLGTAAAALLLLARLARKPAEEEPAPLQKGSWLFIATAAAVLAVTFLLMDVFGFLVGATAIVAGFMALARADIKVMVGTAIAFPVALWLLFDKLLGFPLP